MVDPFSVVASSFAVIGVADVVLRTSCEVCRFLSEIKDAPLEIENLRRCIHENTLLVHTSKQYMEALKDQASSESPSAADLSRAIGLFTSAIRALDRELGALVALSKRHCGARRSWGTVKWVLDQRKISNSLQKLEHSKSTLNNALVLAGRFVSLLITCLHRR